MKITAIILLTGLTNLFIASAQPTLRALDTTTQKVSRNFAEFEKKYPQEKSFIHTDKNLYFAGQTIWYKVYVMAYGKPSQLSKIEHVHFCDAKGKIILDEKLPVKAGTASGHVELPDSLASGWYQLQVFTLWQLNFKEDISYSERIFVESIHGGANYSSDNTAAKSYHVDFFPEGGDLIDGVDCNVAFKAMDENGLPVKISGELTGTMQSSVTIFNTLHAGMGTFEFQPNKNEKYAVKVHFPDNSEKTYTLPKIKETQINLRVNTMPSADLELKIGYIGEKINKNVVVAATQNNGLVATYPLQLSRGMNVVRIKKTDFSTGILRLTLFDENGWPRAERLAFVNNNDQMNFSLIKDTVSNDARGRNVLSVNIEHTNIKPSAVSMSVSVTDAEVGDDGEENIVSYFLMSSELRGKIYKASYYFKNNSDTMRQQLDLVMLTNGWRRFDWNSIFNANPIELKYAVERTQVIAGKIENYHEADNLTVKLLLTNGDISPKLISIQPDSSGRFFLRDYENTGSVRIKYGVFDTQNNSRSADVKFFSSEVDSLPYYNQIYHKKPVVSERITDNAIYELNKMSLNKNILLKTVNVKGQKLSQTEALASSRAKHLVTTNSVSIDLLDLSIPPGSVLDYIQGRFPGLTVHIAQNGYTTFQYRGPSSIMVNKQAGDEDAQQPGEPFFYVDEASTTLDEVKNMPLEDVALISFAPPPVWFAPQNGGSGGAILIYTKRFGDEKYTGRNKKDGYKYYIFNSYAVTREFSPPDCISASGSQVPDNRTTLYWAHDIQADANGRCKIRFCNSDKTKKFRVTIQAMDADGKIGFLNAIF